MFVGVLRLTLHIPGAQSLKDRRQVVRSLKDRLRVKLGVSVAEVGALDAHQRCVLGVVAVSGDAGQVDELLAGAARMASELRDAILWDRSLEIVPFGAEGRGVGERGRIKQEVGR